MTFSEHTRSSNERSMSVSGRPIPDNGGEKRVRIAEEDLSRIYNPKSYSMPDLLVDDSYHEHPNLYFSTKLAHSSIDVRSYLPKHRSKLKQKLSDGLKRFKNITAKDHGIPRSNSLSSDKVKTKEKPRIMSDSSVCDKLHKRTFKNWHIFGHHHHHHHHHHDHKEKSPNRLKLLSSSFFHIERCRSDDNLSITNEDARLLHTDRPLTEGLNKRHRKRSLSADFIPRYI